MRTQIPEATLATARGQCADEILRSCVHCGFCNATCPTYQVRGDELDGPRGRIYLIKGLLESSPTSDVAVARTHLDRCLTCRACETTCPSGVRYGELAEIGRELVQEAQPSSGLVRRLVLAVVPRPKLLKLVTTLGRLVMPLLPRHYRRLVARPPKVPLVSAEASNPNRRKLGEASSDSPHQPTAEPKAWLVQGCVQRVVTPEVNAHLAALLRTRGYQPVSNREEGCCGGLALHLGDTAAAQGAMRSNVAANAQPNSDVIISTASGCGVTLKDYGRLLGSPEAASFATKVKDASEVLDGHRFDRRPVRGRIAATVAWHPPCTLQHGQRITGIVEGILRDAGYRLVDVRDSHICCGSAGAYSLLQPGLAGELKARKAAALTQERPDVIATANIGCQTHLDDAVDVPVVHWIELLQ